MLKMILNHNNQEPIYISSLNKTLITTDTHIKYNINGNLTDNNIINGIDFLAKYYQDQITSINIYNDSNAMVLKLENCSGNLITLTESINDNNYYGYYELLIG